MRCAVTTAEGNAKESRGAIRQRLIFVVAMNVVCVGFGLLGGHECTRSFLFPLENRTSPWGKRVTWNRLSTAVILQAASVRGLAVCNYVVVAHHSLGAKMDRPNPLEPLFHFWPVAVPHKIFLNVSLLIPIFLRAGKAEKEIRDTKGTASFFGLWVDKHWIRKIFAIYVDHMCRRGTFGSCGRK